jgi:cellulose biosynthesis protein BcsQ
MNVYAFWNNKGGTGKTSLAFQAICRYAELNSEARVLAVDLCPQANLSELFLGGLTGEGSANLNKLHQSAPRRSIGGYFEARLPSPYALPQIDANTFVCTPAEFNGSIPANIALVAGDPIVELQANAIATLSNTQIPGTDTWLKVIDWVRDLLALWAGKFDTVFVDANPSFGMYTQIAISSATHLILPVMADDSSRRAVQNAFSLIHGVQLPSPIYSQYSFTSKLAQAGRALPRVHVIAKNRLTQYMGPASAYASVLTSIDNLLRSLIQLHPSVFTFSSLKDGVVEIRDFQTTGVVAFAEGKPFSKVSAGTHYIGGNATQVNGPYIDACRNAIDDLVGLL